MQMNHSPAPDVTAELLGALPKLRTFAISLCGHGERADDLIQETVMKALANLHTFVPGSNMRAWLHTILRNEFYSEFRKRRREVRDADGDHAARMRCDPVQEGHIHFLELRDALDRLPPDHREALILVGASGLSYEDAAALRACAVGTMKSRVSRARAGLAALLAAPRQYSGPNVAGLRATATESDHTGSPRPSDRPAETEEALASLATAG